MTIKTIFSEPKNIAIFAGVLLLGYLGFYEYKHGPSLISPSVPSSTALGAQITKPQVLETIKQPDIKTLKSECVSATKSVYEDNKDKKLSTNDMVWLVNSAYRICLAKKGLTPEDLLSNKPSDQTNQNVYIQEPNKINTVSPSNYLETRKQEQAAECQTKLGQYTACMSEYNAKMTEYSACLSEASNPNSYRYKTACFQPLKSCYKPLCAY